jgi:multiple antibiotic resistance protein
VIAAALIAVAIYQSYGFADRLAELIGASAMNVIMRLSSFLLVSIGIQIFWNGASVLLGFVPELIH